MNSTILGAAGIAIILGGFAFASHRRTRSQLNELQDELRTRGRSPICPIEQGHEQTVCAAFRKARAISDDPSDHVTPPRYRGPTDTISLPSSSRTPYKPVQFPS